MLAASTAAETNNCEVGTVYLSRCLISSPGRFHATGNTNRLLLVELLSFTSSASLQGLFICSALETAHHVQYILSINSTASHPNNDSVEAACGLTDKLAIGNAFDAEISRVATVYAVHTTSESMQLRLLLKALYGKLLHCYTFASLHQQSANCSQSVPCDKLTCMVSQQTACCRL